MMIMVEGDEGEEDEKGKEVEQRCMELPVF